jgi:hypothetical protein
MTRIGQQGQRVLFPTHYAFNGYKQQIQNDGKQYNLAVAFIGGVMMVVMTVSGVVIVVIVNMMVCHDVNVLSLT